MAGGIRSRRCCYAGSLRLLRRNLERGRGRLAAIFSDDCGLRRNSILQFELHRDALRMNREDDGDDECGRGSHRRERAGIEEPRQFYFSRLRAEGRFAGGAGRGCVGDEFAEALDFFFRERARV